MSTKSKKLKNDHKCCFCKKSFVGEDSLIKHSCEKKRRWLEKDNRVNKIAFIAFERFFQIHYPSNTKKVYDDFINSRYYTSFINFSRHIYSLDNIDMMNYIDFIIKRQIPLNDWTSVYVYETYIKEKVLKESLDDAFIRSLKILNEWGYDQDESWRDFFKIVDKDYAKVLLRSGKLSPWMLFLCDGENLLGRFNDQDLLEIDFLLDFSYWNKKIALNKKRVDELKKIFEEK